MRQKPHFDLSWVIFHIYLSPALLMLLRYSGAKLKCKKIRDPIIEKLGDQGCILNGKDIADPFFPQPF